MGVTVTFVAILELMREGLIDIVQTEPYAPLHVRAATPAPQLRVVSNDTSAAAAAPRRRPLMRIRYERVVRQERDRGGAAGGWEPRAARRAATRCSRRTCVRIRRRCAPRSPS